MVSSVAESAIGACFPLAERFANFAPTSGKNDQHNATFSKQVTVPTAFITGQLYYIYKL
jgi:hypothetical protein